MVQNIGDYLWSFSKTAPNYGNMVQRKVFARTVICRDLDVATRVARTDGLDCITLEGDRVSKKGGMTGGFYDHRRSKLKFMNTIRQNKESIKMKLEELGRLKLKLQEIDQKINELVAEQQKNGAKVAHDQFESEQLRQDIGIADKKKQSILKSLEKKEKLLSNVLTQIDQLRGSIAVKREEMGTENHLTPEEKDSLSRLNPEITSLKEKLIACRSNRIETDTRKMELQMNLSTNLGRQKQEFEAIKLFAEVDMLRNKAEMKRQELMEASILVENLTKQQQGVSLSIDERNIKVKNIKDQKDSIKVLEDKYQSTLQDEANELKQLLSKRNTYIAKKEEYMKIDAALDPQYRTAVGNMVRRMADMTSTQFITATFRPELLQVADKVYGVTHKNRACRVNVVTKEEALDFIEHDQSHNAEGA